MDTKPAQDITSATSNAPKSEDTPSDETLKEKVRRLIRDSDKGNTCVSCAGSKMATADAIDNLIEWTITTYRRISAKRNNDKNN